MLLCTFCFCVIGCGSDEDDGPKVEYNITVLSLDEQPLEGVTVAWQKSGKTKGSAKTNADGLASVNIPQGTYKVVISGLGEGLTYPDITVTSDMRVGLSVTLVVMRVTYTAEVKDKAGAPAQNVTVTWSSGSTVAGSAVTGADGKAECELDYGEYTVTVSNLPAGNIYTDTKTATGKAPNAVIELRDGQNATYSVTVRSEGGLKFKNLSVFVYSYGKPIASGKTNNDGVLEFSQPAGAYTVRVPSVQDGYTVKSTPNLTAAVRQGDVVLSSAVRTDEPLAVTDKDFKPYKVGDIIHDYVWTTPYEVDGQKLSYSIAELLETKQAVVINNWGINCGNCTLEMPHMQTVYEKYQDKIEMLAINNYPSNYGLDSDETIVSYRDRNGYTIPMMRDTNSFGTRFGITGWPVTIIVDRYGAIARIENGGIPYEDVWDRMIAPYVSDDYTQTFTPGEDNVSIVEEVSKPDITVPDDHYEKVTAAINNFTATADMYVNWFGETKNEMIWPFILKTEAGVSETDEVLCSSNVGKPNSMSAIYAAVKMPAGKVLTFDYYCDTETGRDILSAAWDGKITVKQISGVSNGWKTCHLYADISEEEHYLTLAYIKDTSSDVGLDNIYIRNVRFENLSAITESTDMLRQAADGARKDNSTEYTQYAEVEVAADGYYHVKLDSLQHSEYAGVDPSPMLFANLMDVTNWSGYSISSLIYLKTEDGKYVYNCTMTKDGQPYNYRDDLIEYCRIAAASDVSGYVPVDDELCAILKAFTAEMEKAEDIPTNAKAWLNLCSFYSHYGDGEFIGNPIIGLTTKTAIVATLGQKITADLNRVMAPFPTAIYSFTPTASAVYKIESLLPADSSQASQVWLYDDGTNPDNALTSSGDERFVRDGVNEHNFVVYRYLEAGHKYYIEVAFLMQEMGNLDFKITNAGQSKTELLPCSSSMFNAILGPDGESIVGVELAGAVSYYKDDEGYYRVGDENDKHDEDPYIYLDVKYPTSVSMSFTNLVDQYVKIPYQDEYCDFKSFDFRYRIAYSYKLNGSNQDPTLLGYVIDYDLTKPNHGIEGRDYKDYTAMVKGCIEQSKTTDGLVKVNDEIKDMLILFIETRINALNVYDNGTIEYESAQDNEWLRLCWYYYTHSAQNP